MNVATGTARSVTHLAGGTLIDLRWLARPLVGACSASSLISTVVLSIRLRVQYRDRKKHPPGSFSRTSHTVQPATPESPGPWPPLRLSGIGAIHPKLPQASRTRVWPGFRRLCSGSACQPFSSLPPLVLLPSPL